MRKVAGQKRGIAGTKRKKYLAAKALETRKEFVKSKLYVSSVQWYECHLLTVSMRMLIV